MEKLSRTPKTSFVWEKKNRIKVSGMWSILVQCCSKCRLDFCSTYNFSGNFFKFYFMISSQVSMKEWTRMLIHARKIFNCRVSFKMLLTMCLIIAVDKKLRTYCDQVIFRMALSKNYHNNEGHRSYPNLLSYHWS